MLRTLFTAGASLAALLTSPSALAQTRPNPLAGEGWLLLAGLVGVAWLITRRSRR